MNPILNRAFFHVSLLSPLPSPYTFVPLSGSIPFLLPLSFKPTPYSGSGSEVGQPPKGHLEMWEDVLAASVHEGPHFCHSLGSGLDQGMLNTPNNT